MPCIFPHRFDLSRVILADATLPVSSARGAFTQPLIRHLGSRLQITRDVFEELVRKQGQYPALREFTEWVEADETNRVFPLSAQEGQQVLDLARGLRGPQDHPRKNIGECATIVGGRRLKATRVNTLLVLDDNQAQSIARRLNLAFGTTAELLIEMVCKGTMTKAQGAHGWRSGIWTDQRDRWEDYDEKLSRHGIKE